MLLVNDTDAASQALQLKQSDEIVLHELGRNRPAYESGKFLFTACGILTDLNGRKLIASTLRLDGYYILAPVTVYSDVDFVNFDLSNGFHRRAKVALERIGHNSQEDIH